MGKDTETGAVTLVNAGRWLIRGERDKLIKSYQNCQIGYKTVLLYDVRETKIYDDLKE